MPSRAPDPRRISVVLVNSAWPPATTPSDGTSSSTSDASAPSPSSTIVRAWIARPGAPTVQRTTIGASSTTPAGTRTTTPWLQAARLSCASLSSAARPVVPAIRRRAVSGSRRTKPSSVSTVTPARRAASERTIEACRSSSNAARAASPSVARGGRRGGGRGRRVGRDDVPQHGGAQVHVRRVQAVRLDRQRLVRDEGAAALVGEPVGLGGGEPLHEGRVEPVGQVLGSRPGRAGPRRRRGRGVGHLRHPSEPSISSFTSRLNSMAYSIGSSLVNTSRNPWMIRFWASFSVRPRLMR